MDKIIDILAALGVPLLAFLSYKMGYEKGYGDAVQEYLDNLERREHKNWTKCMKKYMEGEAADDGV